MGERYNYTWRLLLAMQLVLLASFVSCHEIGTVVIGIYAQPSHFQGYSPEQKQYVLNANIQFVEAKGAKAVIIPFDETEEFYTLIMQGLNGLLFTGGDLNIIIDIPIKGYSSVEAGAASSGIANIWTKNAKYLIDLAKQKNDEGISFVVWGNCQGFQLMQYIASGFNSTILHHIENDQNVIRTLLILGHSDYLFAGFTKEDRKILMHKPTAFYYHELAVTESDYTNSNQLNAFYSISALSANSTHLMKTNSMRYVSAIHAKDYPFYGLQFHPEYTLFEAKALNITQDANSINYNERYVELFYNAAKKCSNSFVGNEVLIKEMDTVHELVHPNGSIFDKIAFIDRRSPFNTL